MLYIIVILSIILVVMCARLLQLHFVKHKLLLTSQERFSTIFESVLPLLVVNRQGDVISANQRASHLFEYDHSQLIGMKIEALMPARFREHHIVLRQDYMKHPVARPMGKERNLSILTGAGKEVPVEIALTPIKGKNNFCMFDADIIKSYAFDSSVFETSILCTINDITHQKKHEEMLLKAEKRYRQLYELMNEGYCIIEMIFDENKNPIDFLYVEINPAFEKQTGLKNPERKKVSEVIPNLEKKWFELFGQIVLTGKAASTEGYVLTLHRWFKVYAFRLGPAENKQLGIIFTNITEQKEHEKRLYEYGKFSLLLYKSMQIATETQDIKGAMQNCLNFICEFLDFPVGHIYFPSTKKESAFESSHIWHLKYPEKFQKFKEASERIKFSEFEGLPGRIWKTKKPAWIFNVQEDNNFPRKNYCKEVGIYTGLGFPLFSDEKVVAIFEFYSCELQADNAQLLLTLEEMGKQMSGIFENKKIHKELEEYAEKLKSLNKKLDDFAYIVSHDLKEPLRGIHTFSHFLLNDYAEKIDKDGKEKLDMLINLSQRMHTLIDQLLEYSKIGNCELAIQYCDIGKIIEEKLILMENLIKEKNVEIKILKKMPTILCDKTYIGEAFQNLISNAIKYNDNDFKKIEISYNENDKFTIFSVKDNGIGIPAESYDRVFKMFARLHTKDKYSGGDGFGLAIVKQIVERHDGNIWIESTVGLGTTFYFSIKKNLGSSEI